MNTEKPTTQCKLQPKETIMGKKRAVRRRVLAPKLEIRDYWDALVDHLGVGDEPIPAQNDAIDEAADSLLAEWANVIGLQYERRLAERVALETAHETIKKAKEAEKFLASLEERAAAARKLVEEGVEAAALLAVPDIDAANERPADGSRPIRAGAEGLKDLPPRL